MNKDKEFIKEIKIDNKKRLKYNIITLVIFNVVFVCSLIYLFASLKHIAAKIFTLILFILVIVGTIRTIISVKNNRKCILYRDKIKIESRTFNGDIDLSKVYMVKSKKNIFEIIFKKDAHVLCVYTKDNPKNIYILPFICEDTISLCDEIMALAIYARNKKKSLIVKKIKSKK